MMLNLAKCRIPVAIYASPRTGILRSVTTSTAVMSNVLLTELLASVERQLRVEALQHGGSDIFEGRAIRVHLADQSQALKPGHQKASQRAHISARRQFATRSGPCECFAK